MKNNKQNCKTAVEHLLTAVPTASPEDKVMAVIKLIRRKKNWDTINYIYVLSEKKELVGVISIKELLRAKDNIPVKKIMVKDAVGISASAKQEKAVTVAIKHNIKAVPIFRAKTKEFLGVVGPDQVLSVLHREHVEDFLLFSGIVKEHPTVDIFKDHSLRLVRLRLPWLLVGLVGGMVSAALVSKFQPTMQQAIATVFFMPVVVYISNAISIQTQALLIRLLASQKIKTRLFLKKELLVSLILAIISATVIAGFVTLWLQSFTIALTVALAIVISTLFAVAIATVIPLILYSLKKDPALGSGPFTTAMQDISTLLIYFLIATLIIF